MKVLYYDCFCGISGDMNLGALIDLGVDKEYLIKEISKLNLDSEYEISIRKAMKNGITGTKFDVILKVQDNHNHEAHTCQHEHGDHHHEHHHEVQVHEHHHRNLNDIEKIINNSSLSDKVKKLSLDMFMKVAQAEAEVHGKPISEVHFHEVGAIDSIIDLVGAAIALDYLNVEKVIASTVQVGGGFVKCAHGLMPVPAPATSRILKNIPIKSGLVPFETTTPTGAAILAQNVSEFTDQVEFSIEGVGYGLGTRDLEIPNTLRVYIGEQKAGDEIAVQHLFETNIDDMNPELYGYVEEKLFEAGALDVFKTPIIMKKGRPAIKLSILVDSKQQKEVLNVLFKKTTTIGVRRFDVGKIMMHREFSKVKTKYGEVIVKKAFHDNKFIKYKAEYEDCKKIALKNNISIAEVYREVDNNMDIDSHSQQRNTNLEGEIK
ncbi:nickel pincer cofactor biosynthesis protein LarC [Clostridium oryzae]|uniref:Pyridinium-3,5-bisthiocarboxylic acid mononucleotide nickel insertion protein n=1 Tax=Clostridium oryzae TaxID=1450648 RepID=A0A1V4IDW9_9CLOT|nr:nickel pincer cofactor biosynthesis protein LarC [Clostridium oryzae]OPJ57737.1 hypothetical protein CLORY_39650 [Clostridium oryzae]